MASAGFLLAFLGGVVPAIIWLSFWLLEDRRDPEPKRYILYTFLAGAAVVIPLVLPAERYVCSQVVGGACPSIPPFLVLLAWAFIEECAKFGAAYAAALHWEVYDEPVDAVIYMITAALGFSAFENMLFILAPLQNGMLMQSIITGDLRFVGASLLHILASSAVGVLLALSFYRNASIRRYAALFGVVLATILHAFFNFFILNGGGSATFWIFLIIWLGIVALLFVVERIKRPSPKYRH